MANQSQPDAFSRGAIVESRKRLRKVFYVIVFARTPLHGIVGDVWQMRGRYVADVWQTS